MLMRLKIDKCSICLLTVLLTLMLIMIFINRVAGYENFNGTISNITSTNFACSICLKTDVEHTCVIYKDTTCFDNTIYAENKHTECLLTKRILEPNNQQQFISDTSIGNKVMWYKHLHNHKCKTDIKSDVSFIKFIINMLICFFIYTLYMNCYVIPEPDEETADNNYKVVNQEDNINEKDSNKRHIELV